MNSITDLLDLEDSEIIVDDIQIQDQTKTIVLSTVPIAHFCPSCGFKMHSRGIKVRTINHPILQLYHLKNAMVLDISYQTCITNTLHTWTNIFLMPLL